jgi:hypothetical protein
MQGLWSNSLNFVKPKVGRDPVIGQGAIFPDQTNQHFWPKQWGNRILPPLTLPFGSK